MTISLMSLLGGSINLSAATGNEDAGDVALDQTSDAAFETIMAAAEMQEVSAEKLRQFFIAHGAEIPASLTNGQPKSAGQVLAQIIAANDGKKLPGDMIVALQEILPQNVVGVVEQSLAKMQGVEDADMLAQLPERELTPEELSMLVQETGLPPVVIFAALQETPAASPNLAYAMVEDMGAAEADANLPLPKDAATAPQPAQNALTGEQSRQVADHLARVDFSNMDADRREVLKRIVNVLRGDAAQGEFDWSGAAMPAAANTNTKPATGTQPQAQSAAPSEGNGAASANTANGLLAGQANGAQANGAQGKTAAMPQQNGAELQPAAQAKPDAAAATPTLQSADAPQQSFASTMAEQTALRGHNGTEAMQAQLRQTHYPQGTPTEQVSVHIAKAVADGGSKMEIHLKPAELGSVDVTIKTDADGRSHVTVTADKRDTLDMLQRDARGLERALADAGLKTDGNSLSFNLRGGEGQQQQAQQQDDGRGQKAVFDINGNYADLDEKIGESENALTYDAGRAYRLNVDWGVDISV